MAGTSCVYANTPEMKAVLMIHEQSITFWRVMFTRSVRESMPLFFWITFLLGHTTLTFLNLIWYVYLLIVAFYVF